LWERTACPSNTTNVAKANGGAATDSCAAIQLNLCHYLRDPPNATNANVDGSKGAPTYPTTTGLGINDPILDACINQGTGLSIMMAENIMAHACANDSHMEFIVPNQVKDGSELEHYARVDCRKLRTMFEAKLRDEEQSLFEAISNSSETALLEEKLGGTNEVGGAASGARTQ
jgi:hypothetical protein